MVTVVITTCKRETEIVLRAIHSVIAQTYPHWELVIVDDSPNDFSFREGIQKAIMSLAQKYPIQYIANSVNSGACFSRNVGIDIAKGEYIAFLDDDDEWMPDKLSQQMMIIDGRLDVALVYSPFIQKDEVTGKQVINHFYPNNGSLYELLMKRGNFIGGTSVPLMRLSCVRAVGKFDIEMKSAQDFDLWLRLAKYYMIACTDIPNVIYYIHAGEQISTNPTKKIDGIQQLIRKNEDYIKGHRDIQARYYRALSGYYKRLGNSKKAYILWLQAVCRRPLDII